jgi:hypothetical protein
VPDDGEGIEARRVEAGRVTGRILPACGLPRPERRLEQDLER